MDEKYKRISIRLLVVFWFCLFIFLFFKKLPDNNLHLVFCDVGQGDAIVARYKNNQILIDGGPLSEAGKLLQCLDGQMAFWDRTIETVINTHPDEDHFGGLIEILKRYKVKTVLTNGEDNFNSPLFAEFKNLLSVQKVYTKIIGADVAFKIGKIYFDSLFPYLEGENEQKLLQAGLLTSDPHPPAGGPAYNFKENDNNKNSLVLRLRFGNFTSLLTGDLPAEEEQILVWRKILPETDILKLGHHGSKSSTSDEILAATKPSLAVISVGRDNRFNHPSQEVLEKLTGFSIEYLRTDEVGSIEIISDGKGWFVK